MTPDPGLVFPRQNLRWLGAATVCFAAAAGLSLLLARLHLFGAPLPAGCGGSADCGAITATRWAYWGPLPVIFAAVVLYFAVLAGLLSLGFRSIVGNAGRQRIIWSGLVTFSLIAMGAALWFTTVQGLVLRRVCPFCVATHLFACIGSLLVLRMAPRAIYRQMPLSIGAGAIALLIAGQLWLPRSARVAPAAGAIVTSRALDSREVELANGRVRLNAADYPALSKSPVPSHFAAVMFDYTCEVCRADHAALTAALTARDDALAILLVPTPLDPACNPAIDRLRPEHANACQYARFALAVWLVSPPKFAAYDAWLMAGGPQPPPLSEARRQAETVVGAEALERALRSVKLDHALSHAGQIYQMLEAGEIPKTLLRHRIVTGRFASRAQLDAILKQELGRGETKGCLP